MTKKAREEVALVTPQFQRRIEAFGENGRRWLEDLPAILEACAQRWQLQVDPPVDDLSYNYVAPAVCEDGQEVILKLGVPRAELNREVLALRAYDGRGSVRLIDADPQAGIPPNDNYNYTPVTTRNAHLGESVSVAKLTLYDTRRAYDSNRRTSEDSNARTKERPYAGTSSGQSKFEEPENGGEV